MTYRVERLTATGSKPVDDRTFTTLAEAKKACQIGHLVVRPGDGAGWYRGPSGSFGPKRYSWKPAV